MASLVQRPNKHKWVQWVGSDGKRRTLRLGKCTKRDAERHQLAVESILSARAASHSVELGIARFIGALDGKIRQRYEALGLAEPQEQTKPTELKAFLDSYFGAKAEAKQSTKLYWGHTRKRLVEYFGANRAIATITATDARAFRVWLETSNKRDQPKKHEDGTITPPSKLSPNTIRKRCGLCREIFGAALAEGLIERNPFQGLPTSVRGNKERQHYVDMDTFEKVLAAAPNAKWRCLLVLARIGAVRMPSEVCGLRWSHINWDRKRITILSSKTERHEGKGSRIVPLFDSLETELLKLFAEPTEGDRLFPDIDADTNLRTAMLKIIRRAGVKQWPKLFQNLRASGATDLARTLPSHVAAAICGHSVQIAQEHYWQTGDSDLDLAIELVGSVKQKPKQTASDSTRHSQTRTTAEAESAEKIAILQGLSTEKWAILDSKDPLADRENGLDFQGEAEAEADSRIKHIFANLPPSHLSAWIEAGEELLRASSPSDSLKQP